MLVSVAELTEYMGGFQMLPARQTFVETVILPGIQGELENHCNRPLELVHVREADPEGYIVFSVTPVVSFVGVTRSDGEAVTIPKPLPDPLPAMTPIPGITRELDIAGVGVTPYPHKLYVGPILFTGPTLFLTQAPVSYLAEYVGGINGTKVPGLKTAIMRVAAREVEKQFDETMSLRGGGVEAADDSDDRDKYWTEEELKQWDRYRRRVTA